ncbi:DUF4192 domain-containing protein [Aeromicrobium sp.]|uniref:DUF4192 domain-containing protein n=1 Tax=Aeromicrobium sp. TaxID=1871063 RepID=UPI00199CEB00|nr:DUF4192 domain-containing protein [Aeromicrobium sp.]MBC7632856.1 DUF4192 domain-containing protein [Aeromicrobium sp.]
MTDTRTVYTAHDVPDLIATLPTLFGFAPSESLVAIATHGERRRFGFRLRVDIPDDLSNIETLAAVVAGHLRRQGAEGAILVAVTQRQDVAELLLPAVEERFDDIEGIVSIRADGSRYWTTDPGFPVAGIAYETSDHHIAVVHAIAAGQQILPDRQALVDRFGPVTGVRRTWLENATNAVLEGVVPLVANTEPGDLAAVGMRVVQPILDRGLAKERLTDDELVRFFVWASGVSVRDEIWAQIVRSNAERMLGLLTLISRNVVPPFEPAVLSLAAFAAWLTGDGAQALIAVERAMTADPDYSMAGLMLEMLEAGISPTCWTGFRSDDDRASEA